MDQLTGRRTLAALMMAENGIIQTACIALLGKRESEMMHPFPVAAAAVVVVVYIAFFGDLYNRLQLIKHALFACVQSLAAALFQQPVYCL